MFSISILKCVKFTNIYLKRCFFPTFGFFGTAWFKTSLVFRCHNVTKKLAKRPKTFQGLLCKSRSVTVPWECPKKLLLFAMTCCCRLFYWQIKPNKEVAVQRTVDFLSIGIASLDSTMNPYFWVISSKMTTQIISDSLAQW